MDWTLGVPMITPVRSGGRDGPCAVVPFGWRQGELAGSGLLTYRVLGGRLECVGVRLGDPGGPTPVASGTAPEPALANRVFRALPFGSLIAGGARLVAENGEALTALLAAGGLRGSGLSDELRAGLAALDLRIAHPGPRRGRPLFYGGAHYQAVADLYMTAWRTGDRSPTKAVANATMVARSTAAKWVGTARRLGYLGPTEQRRPGVIQRRPGPDEAPRGQARSPRQTKPTSARIRAERPAEGG